MADVESNPSAGPTRVIRVPKGSRLEVVTDDGKDTKTLGRKSIYAEAGVTGLKRFGGLVQDEFLPELRGKRGVRIYTEMAQNDASIGAVLRATEDVIRSVSWSVDPGGLKPEDVLARDFILSCMGDMSMSWADLISSVTTMITYGWDWEEVVYKMRQGPSPGETKASSKYNDGRIGWRKIATRSQESLLRWEIDDNGGILAMTQQALPDLATRTIPIEKSVLFRTRRHRNSPEGFSLLRNSYLAWYMKRALQEIEGIGAERDFTGALIINLPERATALDRDKARDLIERWKIDEQFGAVVPFGWVVNLISSPGSKQIDTDKAILRYQAEMFMSFLAQFMRLGQVKVGTQALVTGQRDFFYLSIEAILDNIEETINRFLVPPLIKLNDFGSLTDFPKIVHGKVGHIDLDAFVNALAKIAQYEPDYIGNISPDDVNVIREIVGLPPVSTEKPTTGEKVEKQSTPPRLVPGQNPFEKNQQDKVPPEKSQEQDKTPVGDNGNRPVAKGETTAKTG